MKGHRTHNPSDSLLPPPHPAAREWTGILRPPSPAELHRMAGKSPVSSVVGMLALLALGALMLYGVQSLSQGIGPAAPQNAAAAQGTPMASLYAAAAKGDAAAISKALAGPGSTDINTPSADAEGGRQGLTPLMIACMDGNAATVKALLDAKAKTEVRTPDGRTALMFAAGWGDAQRVQALLDAGARVDAKTNDGRTPLMWAAHRGDVGSVRALLAAGAHANETNKWRQTALVAAAGSGSVEKVTALLDSGADVRMADQRGETALYAAASVDQGPAVLELLIGRGAAVDAADADGVTPLMKAAERADAEQVRALVKAGASLAAKDRINGWTARDWASKRDDEKGKAVADLLTPAAAK